jgi:predicted nucleic acid-binding protein
MSGQCRRLLERGAQREVNGVLTTIAVAQFCHRRLMQEAQSRGLSGSNPAKALAQNPALVRQLTQYRQEVEDLLSGDLLVLVVESADFVKAAELQGTHGLLTNDSLNVAVALRSGVNLLATADPQSDSIPGMTVFKPDDL